MNAWDKLGLLERRARHFDDPKINTILSALRRAVDSLPRCKVCNSVATRSKRAALLEIIGPNNPGLPIACDSHASATWEDLPVAAFVRALS